MSLAKIRFFRFPFRVVYMVEAISSDGVLVSRRYARNKSLAFKISRAYSDSSATVYVRKLRTTEFSFINPEWVEG